MGKYTMRNLAEDILKEAKAPLSSQEIWTRAEENGYSERVKYSGSTPPHLNLYNTLNGDIKNNANSIFAKVSKNPALFILKQNQATVSHEKIEERIEQIEKIEDIQSMRNTDYNESDLHPALAIFVSDHSHFSCRVKTIHQQPAKRRKKREGTETVKDDWTYPDLIGVYFPFDDYEEITTSILQKASNISTIKVFSFEMKKILNPSSLRSNYFQAVSNSSWANEGYLVAAEVSDDPEFMKELTLLTNSFGIGVIKLNTNNPKDSQIIIPARLKEKIDIDILDKLIERSPDVRAIFKIVLDSFQLEKIVDNDGELDRVYDDDEYGALIANGLCSIGGRKK